jgi:mannitol/fructose-specific phosphotransferase system IIA component (Ntr-type)
VVFVTIGVLNPESLKHDLTPISNGAGAFGGDAFRIAIGIGAFLAFISTANAGVMTASRYPFGMSRDGLLPVWLQRVGRRTRTPYAAILCTGAFMILAISLLRLELLVKVASSVLIVLYMFANLTLILFRESKLLSYKPKFHAPFYPYLQMLGILGSVFLLIEMGSFIVFLTVVFLLVGAVWYRVYAHKTVTQNTALVHVLERLVARDKELGTGDLLDELKEIVVQREGIIGDKFQALIEEGIVLDIASRVDMEDFFGEVSDVLEREANVSREEVFRKLLEREAESSTVLVPGLAIPHVFVDKQDVAKVVLVRAREGITFPNGQLVRIAFVLLGSTGRRLLHLKILAAIAQITSNPEFEERWFEADTKEELRHAVLLAERVSR